MTTYLLRLKIADDGVDVAEQLVYEGHHLPHLDLYKLPPALLRNLDEGVTRHVLHSLVGLVHELEKFVHDRLQEAPVGAEKAWILSHYVHDVGSDDGLVVLAFLLLTQSQQIFYDGYLWESY